MKAWLDSGWRSTMATRSGSFQGVARKMLISGRPPSAAAPRLPAIAHSGAASRRQQVPWRAVMLVAAGDRPAAILQREEIDQPAAVRFRPVAINAAIDA